MNVWGTPIQHDTGVLEESSGGEDCNICCAASVEITFKPCGHAACKNCVSSLRRVNIFRADTGVKCPYCRSYVEAYEPLNKASSLTTDLSEANLAARNAAIARGGKAQKRVQDVELPAGHSASTETWQCSCGKQNTEFRDKCIRCSKPYPVTARPKRGVKKDLLQCSPDEMLQYALEKMHPNLDSAFEAAGMPVSPTSAVAGNGLLVGGDERSITAAISRGQLQQLNRVVKTLVDNHHVRTMIFHWFGNYTLQDLVTATSKLRSTTITILTKMTEDPVFKNNGPVQAMRDICVGKSDLLGTLIREITKDAVEAAVHKQGTYALQKVLESPCTASEFVALGNELLKSGRELLGSEPGIYVMAKLVEQLSSAAATDMGNEAGEQASVILDSICELYHNGIVQYMDGQRYEKLRYDMLISSLDGALPKQHAAVLAVQMASHSLEMCKRSAGRFVIKALMVIPAVDAQCQEIMSNVCCHVANSFEQSVVQTTLKTDERPPHVIQVLTEQLNLYEEFDWLETITMELVDGSHHLKAHWEAMIIVKATLALSGLSAEFFETQIKALGIKLGPEAGKVETEIRKQRQKNLSAAAAAAAAPAVQAAFVPLVQPAPDAAEPANGMISQEYPTLGQAAVAQQNARNGAAQHGKQAARAQAPPDSPKPDIKRIAFSGAIPDLLSSDQIEQLRANAELQKAKQGPPGYEQKAGTFADADGMPGPSDNARQGLIAASPVRAAYQPGQYTPPNTPPVATLSDQDESDPLSFMARQTAPARPYMPPADASLNFHGLTQGSGRQSPVYSPRDHAPAQAPVRAPAYMPHLAEAGGPGAAKPPPGAAAKAARPAQEFYNPPAARNGDPAAASRADLTDGHAAPSGRHADGWEGVADPSDILQQQSEAAPFNANAIRPYDYAQQRQMANLEQKAGLHHAYSGGVVRAPQQRAAPTQARAVAQPPPVTQWTCPTCTYTHEKDQAGFLACALCGSVRKP